MDQSSLAIAQLPAEFQQLRSGGLYWVASERLADAEGLAVQLVAGNPELPLAGLIAAGTPAQALLERLGAGRGPAELRAYQASAARVPRLLADLPLELQRGTRGRRAALWVVLAPHTGWSGLSDARLQAWCTRLARWALQHQSTVVLLSHGDSAGLGARLQPLNNRIDGLAQLYPAQGELNYLLHFWMNPLGVVAAREFGLQWQRGDDGHQQLVLPPQAQQQPLATFEHDANDHRLYLADKEVLEGAPPLSDQWQVHDGWPALLSRANRAQAASVLFAIHGNSQVDALAEAIYRLRRERGNALKLVVREMAPCLRYADERLLLDCGASLIVPHGTTLARFLTLLDSVQGHRWQGTLPPDFAAAVHAFRPPDVKGVVSPAQFVTLVEDIDAASATSDLDNALVQLDPMPGLRPVQALSQCQIRRHGDLACLYRGQIYLFLFACRRDGVERALGNLFRLSWREMFSGYQLIGISVLEGMRQMDEVADLERVRRNARVEHAPAAAAVELPPLRPTPVLLPLSGGGR
jgi:cellulose biosynthesis protein BcsE